MDNSLLSQIEAITVMKLILALFLGFLSYSCCTAESPKAVVIQKPNWPLVFRGEHISLTCDIQGQPPDGDRGYRWYRDNQPLGRTSEKNDISLGQVDKSFNNSLYKCVVIIENQRPHLESEPHKIHVLEIPRATITIQSPQQPFYSGDRVTLRCDITQGLGWEYIWERNNTIIQESVSGTITISLPEESGHYQCSGIRRQLRTFDATISVVISGCKPIQVIMGVAVAGAVGVGVVLIIAILSRSVRRRQRGPVSNSSGAEHGLAERNTSEHQHQSDEGGLPIYETISLAVLNRPVIDTVYDKLSLCKMGISSPLSDPYQLVE